MSSSQRCPVRPSELGLRLERLDRTQPNRRSYERTYRDRASSEVTISESLSPTEEYEANIIVQRLLKSGPSTYKDDIDFSQGASEAAETIMANVRAQRGYEAKNVLEPFRSDSTIRFAKATQILDPVDRAGIPMDISQTHHAPPAELEEKLHKLDPTQPNRRTYERTSRQRPEDEGASSESTSPGDEYEARMIEKRLLKLPPSFFKTDFDASQYVEDTVEAILAAVGRGGKLNPENSSGPHKDAPEASLPKDCSHAQVIEHVEGFKRTAKDRSEARKLARSAPAQKEQQTPRRRARIAKTGKVAIHIERSDTKRRIELVETRPKNIQTGSSKNAKT